ncbi:hypothetical protein JCM10914_226 [Paenibacillus sp. JCM 10914]|nr:hypothetical protein JCM10914_226 [Paenibacillus sp. JCM 10914]
MSRLKRVHKWAAAIVFMLITMGMYLVPVQPAAAANEGSVYVIPVKQQIERGLTSFMERGFKEAEEMSAGLIVLEIDTPGGRVDSAGEIATLIKNSPVPVVAYVTGDAASAGAYIALNANKIAMSSGSMIGAAAMVDGRGNPIEDAKLISWWKTTMASAAESSGRNANIAKGMADINETVEMPEIGITKQPGQIISLTADEALKTGYADIIAGSTNEVIAGWITRIKMCSTCNRLFPRNWLPF